MSIQTTTAVARALAAGASYSSTCQRTLDYADARGLLNLSRSALVRYIRQTWNPTMDVAREKGFSAPSPKLPKALRLLTESAKTEKGRKIGVLTGIAYLSPATESGWNACPFATRGCAAACLGSEAGMMIFSTSKNARLWRTALYLGDRVAFRLLLLHDAAALVRRADRDGLIAAVRVDGSSDTGEGYRLAEALRAIGARRYDYTKNVSRARVDADAVLSWSGENADACFEHVRAGGNVAVVFAESLPATFGGVDVVSGDEHDARFHDARGVVVGLLPKGKKARDDRSGFVVRADDPRRNSDDRFSLQQVAS